VVLKNPIEILLSNTIVKYVFENIDYTCVFDVIFFVVLLVGFILTWHRYNIHYITSKGVTYGLTVLTAIHFCYRFLPSQWIFEPLQFIPFLKYFDIIFIVFIGQIILHYFPRKKQSSTDNKQNSFLNDAPILEIGDDKLGYNTYAEEIGSKILSSHFDKSFAIGINGQWGHGKSSFINLIKKKVKGDDIIEVDFNPWDNHSPEAIIKNFFEEIQDAARPYHSSLSSLFTQYSDKLLALESNTITRSIQTLITTLTDFDSEDGLYDEINAALKAIDKKLVVYIDDLDRLDSKEIIEVIRLIRNTADFYNTFFVVAYDRNYLIEALKKYNQYKEEKFLEKIFQLEVTLPYFDKKALKFRLAEILKEKLPIELHKDIGKYILRHRILNVLDEWLDNMRDVTRFSNALILNIKTLIVEVDFYDFIRIELIRLKYPSAYNLLHEKRERFFETVGEHGSNYLKLKDVAKNKNVGNESSLVFQIYLCENCEELSIPNKDIPKIIELVDTIFGGGMYRNFPNRQLSKKSSKLSIIHPSKFQRYFKYSLSEGELPYVEFDKARMKPQNEFNEKIFEWIEKGMAYELNQRFKDIMAFDNKDDFEKIIRAIFYLANLPDTNEIIGYHTPNLIEKINLYRSYDLESKNDAELKIFVKELFQNAVSPFIFESRALRYFNNEHFDSFILSKSEATEISIDYLRKYLDKHPKLDRYVWDLYHYCEYSELTPDESGKSWIIKKGIMPDEVKKIMFDLITSSGLDNYLNDIIKSKSFEIGWYAVKETSIEEFFGDWKSFEKILNEKDEADYKYLREFKDFYAKFAETGHSNYIEYKFNDIPV